jgi:hypothetical protein
VFSATIFLAGALRRCREILHRRIPDDLAPALFSKLNSTGMAPLRCQAPAVSLLTRHEIHSIIEPQQSEAFS